MVNLTLAIDDDLLRRARMRALEQGTSVNALVREYLASVAGESPSRKAMREFVEWAERHGGNSGGRSWTRDDLYEERLDRLRR